MREWLHPVWVIGKRELRDQLRDWRILVPLIALTVGFPFLMNAVAYEATRFANQYGGDLVVDRLVPFSILIIGFFPLTISLLGALESFVGEKERGTIEPLLSSPLADWQLYLGKLLVGIISPLVSSMVSIGIYLLIVSRLDIAMPSPLVFAQLIMLTVSHAVLMVSASIVISIQSTSVKAANLMASFVIIPVAILMQGETTLLFWGNNQTLWLAVVAALIVSGLIVRLGLAHFQREYLLGREIDVLNLRWMARTFWGYFKGGAQSASDWYRSLFKVSLRKLRKPILAMVLLAVAGVAVSYFWADRNLQDYVQSADAERLTAIQEQILKLGNLDDVGSQFSAPALFLHNLQAMLFISLLGLTSFGVLGVILYLINIGVVGVLVGLFKVMGYNPLPLVALGILPHGVFEIPALILACAATLHIGLVLVTPQAGRTIGEILLEGLADWARVVVGLVVPLLAVAALIEAHVTPQLLLGAVGFMK